MRITSMSITDAATPFPPDTAAEQLPDDPAILKRMILELLTTLQEVRHEREHLQQRLHVLLQRLYGRKNERFDPQQPLLFPDLNQPVPEAPATAETAPNTPAEEPAAPQKPRGQGRRRSAQNLPHKPVHHRLTAAELACPGCGQQRVEIGTETTSQLDFQPASYFITDHIEHKYACALCSKQGTPQFVAASKPEQPLGKGSPGAGLLAHLIVSKYHDHLPLYRQEQIQARQGLELARSTTCDWMAKCARRLEALYALMISVVLQSKVLHTDDTPVKLQEVAVGAAQHGRVWIYWGDREHPYNVFDFTPNRKRDGPQQFLRTYTGYLQADAFAGYDRLYLPEAASGQPRIIEVGCNAHARRKFHLARDSNAAVAHRALAYYGRLYEIERQAKELPEDVRLQMRHDLAVPILEELHTWLSSDN
jgi:transposase